MKVSKFIISIAVMYENDILGPLDSRTLGSEETWILGALDRVALGQDGPLDRRTLHT